MQICCEIMMMGRFKNAYKIILQLWWCCCSWNDGGDDFHDKNILVHKCQCVCVIKWRRVNKKCVVGKPEGIDGGTHVTRVLSAPINIFDVFRKQVYIVENVTMCRWVLDRLWESNVEELAAIERLLVDLLNDHHMVLHHLQAEEGVHVQNKLFELWRPVTVGHHQGDVMNWVAVGRLPPPASLCHSEPLRSDLLIEVDAIRLPERRWMLDLLPGVPVVLNYRRAVRLRPFPVLIWTAQLNANFRRQLFQSHVVIISNGKVLQWVQCKQVVSQQKYWY